MISASATPGQSLLTPTDHTLLSSTTSRRWPSLRSPSTPSSCATTRRSSRTPRAVFGVTTVLTTVAEHTFSGPLFTEIREALPDVAVTDRTTMNTWEDRAVIDRVNAIGKPRLVMAGLWTSVCIVGPALSALNQGFEVYVVADACGDVSAEAHERAMTRMVQAGVRPMTSLQYLLELQRDWARGETYDAVVDVAKRYGARTGWGSSTRRPCSASTRARGPPP
jgi:hypothetical protein